MKIQKLITLLISIIIYSCKDSPVNSNGTLSLIPLAIGNSWTYKVETFDSLGNKIKEYGYTSTIIGDTLIDSLKWYYMDSSKFTLYSQKNNGIHKLIPGIAKLNSLYYKNPSSNNETYYVWGSETNPVEMRIKMELTTVDFQNVSYKFYNPILTVRDYLKYGVGIVKIEWYGYKSNGESYVGLRSELISYSIK